MSIALENEVRTLKARIEALERLFHELRAEHEELHAAMLDPTAKPRKAKRPNGQRG